MESVLLQPQQEEVILSPQSALLLVIRASTIHLFPPLSFLFLLWRDCHMTRLTLPPWLRVNPPPQALVNLF